MSSAARASISLCVIAASAMVLAVVARLQPPPPAPPSEVESIFPFPVQTVQGIDVQAWQGSIRAARREGRWVVDAIETRDSNRTSDAVVPTEAQIQEAVGALVDDVVSLPEVARFPLEGPPTQFGFDDPRAVLALTLTSGEVVRLEIGDRTTGGEGLYARIAGSAEVLQIGSLILTEIGEAFFRLRALAS